MACGGVWMTNPQALHGPAIVDFIQTLNLSPLKTTAFHVPLYPQTTA